MFDSTVYNCRVSQAFQPQLYEIHMVPFVDRQHCRPSTLEYRNPVPISIKIQSIFVWNFHFILANGIGSIFECLLR